MSPLGVRSCGPEGEFGVVGVCATRTLRTLTPPPESGRRDDWYTGGVPKEGSPKPSTSQKVCMSKLLEVDRPFTRVDETLIFVVPCNSIPDLGQEGSLVLPVGFFGSVFPN